MRNDPGALPDPDTQLFETCFRVRFHEVDALGHVNNSAYLNYLEQAAIDHATFLGLNLERLRRLGGLFVARRHDIIFLKPAFAGELLRVITWLDEPHGARIVRHYLVSRASTLAEVMPIAGRVVQRDEIPNDDTLVVRAVTEWVFADDSGHPRRIPEEVKSLF